eukprot:7667365-Alexandrium_andersonii.AAC.1
MSAWKVFASIPAAAPAEPLGLLRSTCHRLHCAALPGPLGHQRRDILGQVDVGGAPPSWRRWAAPECGCSGFAPQ